MGRRRCLLWLGSLLLVGGRPFLTFLPFVCVFLFGGGGRYCQDVCVGMWSAFTAKFYDSDVGLLL